MKGTKYLSQLITTPEALLPGKINIVNANTSAGKTWFALNSLPAWAGTPEKILYLIDTTNGEMRIQQNMISIDRIMYSFLDYASGRLFGEEGHAADNKMPVMTYAGFGAEIRESNHPFWEKFEYIVCDEMQNLVRYQSYGDKGLLELAENMLRHIAASGKTKIIALSATPDKIRQKYGALCRDVPFDTSELIRYETFQVIPYTGVEAILLKSIGKTGILYTQSVDAMIRYINFARENGIRADGFWSLSPDTQRRHPMTHAQKVLRETVLTQETIPVDLDLLVINDASETCIKIQAAKRKIDYMIINHSDEEKQIQVRGRYCGDLQELYLHTRTDTDMFFSIPPQYLNTPLFAPEKGALCKIINLRANGKLGGWITVKRKLQECGFTIDEGRRNNKRYAIIRSSDFTKS